MTVLVQNVQISSAMYILPGIANAMPDCRCRSRARQFPLCSEEPLITMHPPHMQWQAAGSCHSYELANICLCSEQSQELEEVVMEPKVIGMKRVHEHDRMAGIEASRLDNGRSRPV